MSAQNGTTTPMADENNRPGDAAIANKGKGKAVDAPPQDMSMDEEDESSDEETGAEDDVRSESFHIVDLYFSTPLCSSILWFIWALLYLHLTDSTCFRVRTRVITTPLTPQ